MGRSFDSAAPHGHISHCSNSHKATTVVVATLLPREGSGVSCSLLGRMVRNRIFLALSQKKTTLCLAWLFTTGGVAGTEV